MNPAIQGNLGTAPVLGVAQAPGSTNIQPSGGGQPAQTQPVAATFNLQPASGQNFSGISAPSGGGAPAPAPTPVDTSGNTTGNTGVNTAAGTAGYGINAPEYISGIQQEYNTAIQQGGNLLGQNQANLPINQQLLDAYVQSQQNQAQTQTANQVNTYNTQKSGVQGQQNLSLAELADQIRGQNQGLQAQLGATGAGSSSAAGMGQFALAHEQNLNRANIQQQAGSNISDINAQIQQTQANLQPYLATLNAYKQQQQQQILQNYNTLQTQLEQQIGVAQGEEKARLAMFGQTLQDSAGSALTALDQQIAGATQAFAGQQQAVLANNPGQFQAAPLAAAPSAIQAPTVSPFQVGAAGGAGNASAPAGGSLDALFKQQQQGAAA